MEPQLELYYLELQSKKMFLYASSSRDEPQVFLECISLFDYVRKNPPIRVLHRTEIADSFEVDCYVKKNMKMFGIDNIRGGTYSMEIIPEFLLKSLELEFSTDNSEKLLAIDEIKKKCISGEVDRENIKKSVEEYTVIKNKLQLLQIQNGETIDRSILADLEWLSDCLYTNRVEQIRYNKILLRLRSLYKIFTSNFDKNIENPKLFETPQYTFDAVFYHSQPIYNTDIVSQDKKYLLEKFEYMAYYIINKIEEYEFDLTTYPENIEIYGFVFDYYTPNAALE